MKLFTDSSAFAKRYVLEYGSDTIDELLAGASELAISIILLPEVISALNRRRREQVLSAENYSCIKSQLLQDVHDAVVLQVTPGIVSVSVKLLEKNVLRAMDAIHIASAVEWNADLFVSADKKQCDAASNYGLVTEYLGR